MELSIETLAFFAMLVIVLAVLYALVRNSFTIANLIPVPLAQELIKSAVDTALQAAQRYAETTPTKADDELIALIRAEVAKVLGEAQAAKSDQNAVG